MTSEVRDPPNCAELATLSHTLPAVGLRAHRRGLLSLLRRFIAPAAGTDPSRGRQQLPALHRRSSARAVSLHWQRPTGGGRPATRCRRLTVVRGRPVRASRTGRASYRQHPRMERDHHLQRLALAQYRKVRLRGDRGVQSVGRHEDGHCADQLSVGGRRQANRRSGAGVRLPRRPGDLGAESGCHAALQGACGGPLRHRGMAPAKAAAARHPAQDGSQLDAVGHLVSGTHDCSLPPGGPLRARRQAQRHLGSRGPFHPPLPGGRAALG